MRYTHEVKSSALEGGLKRRFFSEKNKNQKTQTVDYSSSNKTNKPLLPLQWDEFGTSSHFSILLIKLWFHNHHLTANYRFCLMLKIEQNSRRSQKKAKQTKSIKFCFLYYVTTNLRHRDSCAYFSKNCGVWSLYYFSHNILNPGHLNFLLDFLPWLFPSWLSAILSSHSHCSSDTLFPPHTAKSSSSLLQIILVLWEASSWPALFQPRGKRTSWRWPLHGSAAGNASSELL